MVGGNIQGETRVLTTAAVLATSRGQFALAIAFGLVLLAIAFAINLFVTLAQQREAPILAGASQGSASDRGVPARGGRHLLAVDFLEVADGETVAVLGPNGAGKSTLLRALAGLEPAAGEVLLDGEPVPPSQLRAAVAAVLQRPVLQRASVLDNAAAGLRMRGMRRARARLLARPWLDALGIAHLADRHARTLSGGEVQRVAIARALAVRSRYCCSTSRSPGWTPPPRPT